LRHLYSTTIACSSLLLFLIQPIMAKTLLPEFGGSAGVWVTCMLFFQVMLLAGYFYSFLLTTHLTPKTQSIIHAALLAISLVTITLHPGAAATHNPNANPAWPILLLLLQSIGLPYFLLSTTSPLLQSWFAGANTTKFPWWLFALSNAASLAALLSYPILIEPKFHQSTQLNIWWAAYAAFAILAGAAAILSRAPTLQSRERERAVADFRIIALAAVASTLWMAVANHLSQEVAPVPFLWILPLSIYLLTFILCFEGEGWYRPNVFRWLLPLAWCAAALRLAGYGPTGLPWELITFSFALFIWCMFCHGEIARTKPANAQTATRFYLTIALGGALGSLFVGLAAPNLLTTYLELPIGIAATVFLALYLLYGMTSPRRLLRLALLAIAAFVVATQFEAGFGSVIHLRNFYGAIQITDGEFEGAPIRTLYNGKTLHGVEFLTPTKLRQPTAYYGPESGAGQLLSSGNEPRRVGLVGLGVGTLAAYGRPGDTFRFYEINPTVIDVATRDFKFLETSGAKHDVIAGDGRLSLEREPQQSFDVLILDAFADDSIPVHLLTREAFQTYFSRLKPEGILAVHVTNRYLELAPVVESAASALGKQALEVHSQADPEQQVLAADWVLVGAVKQFGSPAVSRANHLWTDDYSNLFQVLK
jgi:hypothetical protein